MSTAELLEMLRAEGFNNAQSWVIGHGITTGKVPKPPLSRSLQFVWEPEHINAVRRYLRNVPKPGRRKAAVC